MILQKDEVYICKEPNCRAEIVVRRGADSTCHGEFNLRCCCGKDMVRVVTTKRTEAKHAAKQEPALTH